METNEINKAKHDFFVFVILVTVGLIGLVCCSSCTTMTAKQTSDSIAVYAQYYDATEKLLDDIEVNTGWSTTYADNGKEEHTTYYEARWAIKNQKLTTLSNTLELYKWYYKESQTLLNMLEDDYNWLDTTGEGDLYTEWITTYKTIAK